jgi:hypothetical protein
MHVEFWSKELTGNNHFEDLRVTGGMKQQTMLRPRRDLASCCEHHTKL